MGSFKYLDRICKFYISLIGLLDLGIKPLFAETVPPTPQVPAALTPKKLQLKLLSQPTIIREISNSDRKTIRVKGFVFKGNTVFSDRELLSVVEPYIGINLSFNEILQTRSLITRFYNEAGYVTSFAFLSIPKNQGVERNKGVVTIQVIEGKLEKIKISGSSRLQGYVRSRLKKAASPVVNRSRLLESLQLLQTDPNIETISAELGESSEPGKSFLNVKLKAHQPFKLQTFANNSRSPTIGSFQRGVQLKYNNMLDLGDLLSLEYRNTDGSNAYSADYSVPINLNDGTVEFSYTNVSSNIVERPFNNLDIIGDARAYKLTFRQPLIRKASKNSTQEFALGLTAERTDSESYLLQTPFPLSEGADDEGRTRISALRFFQDGITRSNRTVLQLRSQFSLGIGAIGATINANAPDSRFVSWRGQALWLRRLAKTSLLLRGDLQLASRPLVPIEQIGLGGASTIRGYRHSTYLSDNGLLLGAELRIPIWKKVSSEFQIIPFVDFGYSWNNPRKDNGRIITPELGSLLSMGLGLEYKLNNKFTARLDWGIPLINENSNNNSNTWQENGIYFNLRYQPF